MPAPPRVPTPACLTGVARATALCTMANAASTKSAAYRFDIPAGPLNSALLDFALQARISISTGPAAQCRPTTNRLSGAFRLQEGLARMLAGTGCGFRMAGDGAVIVFKIQARPAEVLRSAPPAAGRSPATYPGQDLVVTAARRSALLNRAPYSISALTGADLISGGAEDLGDIAPLIAGLSTTNLGPGRDKIFVRGLSDSTLTGNTQSTVGIYLDGARITYNAPDPDLRLVDVERVEILRGPQGALYGAGSIGGLLHIVTRKPMLDAFSASLGASASITAGGAPSRSVEGVLNLPLAPGRLAARLVAYDEVQGGYIDDVRLGLRDVNSTTRRGLRVALRFSATPDWTVTTTVTRQALNTADTHYAEPVVGPLARANFLREPHDNDFLAAGIDVAGHQRWGDVTATTSVLRHQFNSRYDASLALPQFAPSLGVAPSPFDENNRAELLVNEITVASAETGRLSWLGGLFQSVGDDDSTSTLTTTSASNAPVTVYQEARYDLVRELAAYGQMSYRLTPRLAVTAGGRWFHSSVKTRSKVDQPLTGGQSSFTGKTSTSGFAPQAVVRYQPGDDVTLYMQASEGYRSGGFNTASLPDQLFAPAGGGQPRRRYAGDELWNYEAGAKFDFLGRAAQVRMAAFYMIWKGVESDQLLASGLTYTANIGDARDVGWEAELDVRPDAHWRLRANATLSEPELTRPAPGFVARPDNLLPGVPRVSTGVSASYEREVGASLVLRLQANYAYVGGSHLNLDAITSQAMGDYSRGGVSAQISDDAWSLTAFVNGPIGPGSDTFAFGNPFTFRSVAQSTPARPTIVGLQLGVKVK